MTSKICSLRQLARLGALPITKLLLLVLALTVLTSCSQIFSTMDEVLYSHSEADHRKLIANYSRGAFKDYQSYNAVEISAPRLVDSMIGHTSIVCLRFEAQGRQRVYVFFIRNDAIVDSRYDVLTDQCGTQSYEPFSLATGLEKPAGGVPQNPLY